MHDLGLIWQHPLMKTLPHAQPASGDPYRWQAFGGESAAIQLALLWRWQRGEPAKEDLFVTLEGPLASSVQVFEVQAVPSLLPAYPWHDEHYLTTRPGLLPDRLRPLTWQGDAPAFPVTLLAGLATVLYFQIDLPPSAPSGSFPLRVQVQDASGKTLAKTTSTLKVFPLSLPKQTLRHTEWFHADCLADYYRVPVFSEAHWQLCENFIQMAARHGQNMLLTPLFTPPLDTKVGGARTAVQLVKVRKKGQGFEFDFSLLRRWVTMAQSCGIEYFEMSHLFSQWGARFAPRIFAETNGGSEAIFGWHTPADSPAYALFLAQFLRALIPELRSLGLAERTYFHVSDEPQSKDLESYRQARRLMEPHLEGFPILDALSDPAFFDQGLTTLPVPALDHLGPFLAKDLPQRWTYHCCAQATGVSNRFMAMPSWRNRLLGVTLYQHRLDGFLHWGYNFYNSQHSTRPIDPHATTDAGGAFPSGDPFLVYPGPRQKPWPSLRLKVLHQALTDLRALRFLESLSSRQAVLELVEKTAGQPLSFDSFPAGDAWLLRLREKVDARILQLAKPKGALP